MAILAKTPPMGFNTWNTFGPDINEQLVLEMADVMAETVDIEGLIELARTAPDLDNILTRHPEVDGMDIYTELKARNILVRHFTAERICQFNRITIGTREQMDVLLQKTEKILKEKGC